MKNLVSRQQGLTFIGLCFILAFIAIVVMFVVRAFPLYNEQFQIEAAINSVVSRPDAAGLSEKSVRDYFMRNMAITNIERFTDRNVKDHVKVEKPSKQGDPKIMHVTYEARNVLYGNIYLVMVFDKKYPLRGGDTGE